MPGVYDQEHEVVCDNREMCLECSGVTIPPTPQELEEEIPMDMLRQAMKEEAHFAMWEVDYIQWPWHYYPEESLGN